MIFEDLRILRAKHLEANLLLRPAVRRGTARKCKLHWKDLGSRFLILVESESNHFWGISLGSQVESGTEKHDILHFITSVDLVTNTWHRKMLCFEF